MKIIIKVLKSRCFFVVVGLLVIICVKNSNSMMVSEKHKKIAAARAQQRKARTKKSMLQLSKQINAPIVWILIDNRLENRSSLVNIEQWKIHQMKALQLLLAHQQGKNSKNNPIDASKMVTAKQLELLSKAFDALAEGTFEGYYANLLTENDNKGKNTKFGEDSLSALRRASGNVEAQILSALLKEKIFLGDMQQYMTLDTFVDPVLKFLKKNLIKKVHKVETIPFEGTLQSFAFNEDHSQCFMGGDNGKLVLFDMGSKESKDFVGHQETGHVTFVAFNKDSTRVVTCNSIGKGGEVFLWDCQAGKLVKKLNEKNVHDPIYDTAIAFSPDGTQGIVGNVDEVVFFNSENEESSQLNLAYLNNQVRNPKVGSVSWSPDGGYIICSINGAAKNKAIVLRVEDKEFKSLSLKEKSRNQVNEFSWAAFSPEGNRILRLSDSEINMWKFESFDKLEDESALMYTKGCLLRDIEPLRDAGFSSDGKRFFISSYDASWGSSGLILLYDVETGNTIKKIKGGYNLCGAFSQDSPLFVAALNTYYNDVIFFDPATGVELMKFYDNQKSKGIRFGKKNEKYGENDKLFIARENGIDVWQLFEEQDLMTLKTMKEQLNVAQLLLLYQLYLAKEKGLSVLEGSKEEVFKTLPDNVQQMVKTYLLPKQNVLKQELSSIKNYLSDWWYGKGSE